MIDIISHLISRSLDINKYSVYINEETATFLLFNLSGKIVGYQVYRPLATKNYKNHPKLSRYYTYCKNNISVFGLETFHYRTDILFVVEGIFDACKLHNLGLPAIATLSNSPKYLCSWLNSLGRLTISISDNDDAGKQLISLCNVNLIIPPGYKDIGEMPIMQTFKLVRNFL